MHTPVVSTSIPNARLVLPPKFQQILSIPLLPLSSLFFFFFSRVTHDIYRLDTRHLIRRIIDAISGDVTPVCFPRRVNSRRVESARQTLFISLVCVHCRRRAGVNRGVNKTVGFERGFYQVRALYEIPWRYFISFYFSFFFFWKNFPRE